jgi:hypothetical protein
MDVCEDSEARTESDPVVEVGVVVDELLLISSSSKWSPFIIELSFFFKFFAVGFTFIQDFRLDIKYLFAIACSSSPVIQKTNKQVIKCV